VFYEVTELTRGKRLDEIIAKRNKPLSLGEQLDYVEPLCDALIHAHKRKVYHRNLSPETVFVTEGEVKLADFDFAKILGENTIVRPGQDFVNTPMTAPEMLVNPSAASPAADIYSLGALWYFLARLPEKNPALTPERIDALKLLPRAHTLMKKLLMKAIKSRPQSAEEVLDQLKMIREEIERRAP
jgi:serine/threonine protein kinase